MRSPLLVLAALLVGSLLGCQTEVTNTRRLKKPKQPPAVPRQPVEDDDDAGDDEADAVAPPPPLSEPIESIDWSEVAFGATEACLDAVEGDAARAAWAPYCECHGQRTAAALKARAPKAVDEATKKDIEAACAGKKPANLDPRLASRFVVAPGDAAAPANQVAPSRLDATDPAQALVTLAKNGTAFAVFTALARRDAGTSGDHVIFDVISIERADQAIYPLKVADSVRCRYALASTSRPPQLSIRCATVAEGKFPADTAGASLSEDLEPYSYLKRLHADESYTDVTSQLCATALTVDAALGKVTTKVVGCTASPNFGKTATYACESYENRCGDLVVCDDGYFTLASALYVWDGFDPDRPYPECVSAPLTLR